MKIIYISVISTLLGTSFALAEPVDKNQSGPYFGGAAQFGQSFQAGSGNPGAAFSLGAEAGFVLKRDTWNRLEIGGEFSTATLNYEAEGGYDVSIAAFPQVLAKFGYGYSLGEHVFSVFRVGAGMGIGKYEINSRTTDATALIGMLGWDAVVPVGDYFDFVVGANYRIHKFTVDDLEGRNVDSFQLNTSSLYAQARIRL